MADGSDGSLENEERGGGEAMTREWKVGDHLRVGEREGIVVEVIHNALIIDFAGERWTWILPSPALVYLEHEQKEEAPVVKRSRTISPMVVRGYSICDPRDNSELQVTLCEETRYEASYILVRRENTDERIAFDADLEEFEMLLEVAKKLLQKE